MNPIPEKWCVRAESDAEQREIVRYFDEKYHSTKESSYGQWPIYVGLYFHSPKHEDWCTSDKKEEGYRELSFRQFTEYFLTKKIDLSASHSPQREDKKEVRKIVSYKLVKSEYQLAFSAIMKANAETRWEFSVGSECWKRASETKVLDLWFEPIYEEICERIVLGTGKITVKISSGKIEVEGDNEISVRDLIIINNNISSINSTTLTGTKKNYKVVYPDEVVIGCSTFTRLELTKIIDTYEKMSK